MEGLPRFLPSIIDKLRAQPIIWMVQGTLAVIGVALFKLTESVRSLSPWWFALLVAAVIVLATVLFLSAGARDRIRRVDERLEEDAKLLALLVSLRNSAAHLLATADNRDRPWVAQKSWDAQKVWVWSEAERLGTPGDLLPKDVAGLIRNPTVLPDKTVIACTQMENNSVFHQIRVIQHGAQEAAERFAQQRDLRAPKWSPPSIRSAVHHDQLPPARSSARDQASSSDDPQSPPQPPGSS